MPKRKLTEKVKAAIKASKGKVRLKDYTGEALTYLRKYRALSAARKIKKETTLKVDGLVIPKNSKFYDTVSKSAEALGISLLQLQKKFPDVIREFLKRGSYHADRETDYLLEDLEKLSKKVKITVGKKGIIPKEKVIAQLKQLQTNTATYTDNFVLIFKTAYTLDGLNMKVDFPFTSEYEDLLFEIDSEEWTKEESDAAFTEMLNEFDSIITVRSPKK